eukprot:TRINITY_DN4068_c0_g1_i1.p1 TRINITY_DN4068_c0_g1~~TRINITY_DN4068_c0_g1_i1.p1  ORF type:complete len:119 (+),score=18.83 TRINITY_DN4068_c0_g1_i1:135-491(+)
MTSQRATLPSTIKVLLYFNNDSTDFGSKLNFCANSSVDIFGFLLFRSKNSTIWGPVSEPAGTSSFWRSCKTLVLLLGSFFLISLVFGLTLFWFSVPVTKPAALSFVWMFRPLTAETHS